MNCIVFVTVRTASKRLPKKALRKIKGRPLIQILLDRIRESGVARKIVVCTTKLKSDNKLVTFLKNKRIDVFRGDAKDILKRLYYAAKKYDTSEFVVVEGDDIFCEPSLIRKTCNIISKTDYDFVLWNGIPFGSSPLGIKTKPLYELVKNKNISDTETGWGQFIINSGLFRVARIKPKNKKLYRPEIRLSIDYGEDLAVARKILYRLPKKFTLIDIIRLFDDDRSLSKINEFTKKKYEKHFTRKMNISLKKKEKRI